MGARVIRRRKVLYIGGYDPGTPAGFHRRFIRQLNIFQRTWSLDSSCSEASIFGQSAKWTVTTTAPAWSVQTDFELLSWDDIIEREANGPTLVRLGRGIAAYANLIISGTLRRYFIANPRYFAFAVAPLFQLLALVLLAAVVGFAADKAMPEPWSSVAGLAAALVTFAALLKWPGRRWRMHQAFDDWILSRDYIYRRRGDIQARITHFATRIVDALRNSGADEVLVVGHSLGATFAADALEQALAARQGEISFATLGATIPKCTLHPAASWLRQRIAALAERPTVYWVEIQTRSDPISFFMVHPVSLERIGDGDLLRGVNPTIRRAKPRDMLDASTYQKIRLRPLRLHYQCVSANERQTSYDFFMMICGPAPVALWSKSEAGLSRIDIAPSEKITA